MYFILISDECHQKKNFDCNENMLTKSKRASRYHQRSHLPLAISIFSSSGGSNSYQFFLKYSQVEQTSHGCNKKHICSI